MISYKILETSGALESTYARFIAKQTVDINTIVDDIVRSTTLTRADILAALAALADSMAFHLKNGNRVHLNELGYFAPSIEGEIAIDKKGRKTLKKGYVRTIKFQPERKLKGELLNVDFRQVVATHEKSKQIDDASLRQALRELSKGGRNFTTKALSAKLEMSISSAYRLIQRLMSDDVIIRVPSFQHEKLYTLK